VFDLIEGTAGLSGDLSETNLHRYSAGDVIALDARFAVFAALDSGQLFGPAMNCSIFQRRPQDTSASDERMALPRDRLNRCATVI
jgi:hypothetical protein